MYVSVSFYASSSGRFSSLPANVVPDSVTRTFAPASHRQPFFLDESWHKENRYIHFKTNS